MGGGTDITWFGVWSSQAKFPHVSECTPSKLISRHLTTRSGLGLGVTREKLTRQLGTPVHSDSASVKYGFRDGFNETENWFEDVNMGLNQGPIVDMIENHRTGLLWKLFMSNPEVEPMVKAIGFEKDNQR
jgi:hypothetical protein